MKLCFDNVHLLPAANQWTIVGLLVCACAFVRRTLRDGWFSQWRGAQRCTWMMSCARLNASGSKRRPMSLSGYMWVPNATRVLLSSSCSQTMCPAWSQFDSAPNVRMIAQHTNQTKQGVIVFGII